MMSYDDLNNCIENYLINDKTKRALMLTAPRGSGKSYYIKNHLFPYLRENKLKYALVSLYGIQNLKEINKELFIEIKLQKIPRKWRWLSDFGKTFASGTAVVGKTILKQLANVDINFDIREPNYEKIYKSINLKNRLIVFEDLERANIDIVEFLGYVNNLVEQDGAKVLIIANENEILKYNEIIENDKIKKIPTEKSEEYLRIKEKTVGDTIYFVPNLNNSVSDIIKSFQYDLFNKMLEDSSFIDNIVQEITFLNCYNLRSVLYGCQKAYEIGKELKNDLDLNFFKNLSIGTMVYSLKINNGNIENWDNDKNLSYKLGSYSFPLFKSVYDYIKKYVLNIEDVKKDQKLFLSYFNDVDIENEYKTIFYYYVSNEISLKDNIEYLKSKLDSNSIMNYNQYIRLFNYLVSIKYNVGFKELIDDCKEIMLSNIKNKIESGYEIDVYNFSGIELINEAEKIEFNEFVNKILEYKKNNKTIFKDFTYKSDELNTFYEKLLKMKDELLYFDSFISVLDLSKISLMLRNSNAQELSYFRSIIKLIYDKHTAMEELFLHDLQSLKELKNIVCELLSINDLDKINKLQLKWLSNDIDKIIANA